MNEEQKAKKTSIPLIFCRKHGCSYLCYAGVCNLPGHCCHYTLSEATDIVIQGLQDGTWPGTVPVELWNPVQMEE